jgi:hypothetical protein
VRSFSPTAASAPMRANLSAGTKWGSPTRARPRAPGYKVRIPLFALVTQVGNRVSIPIEAQQNLARTELASRRVAWRHRTSISARCGCANQGMICGLTISDCHARGPRLQSPQGLLPGVPHPRSVGRRNLNQMIAFIWRLMRDQSNPSTGPRRAFALQAWAGVTTSFCEAPCRPPLPTPRSLMTAPRF